MALDYGKAPYLDLASPNFDFDSPEVMAAREEHWYAQTPIGPLVLRYRESADLLKDSRFRLGGPAFMQFNGVAEGPLYDWWMNSMMSVDVESHIRFRSLLNKAFTPRRLEDLRPFIRATSERLADQIPVGEVCDFVAAFAAPLPALVMCELLGVPVEDYDQFHAWSDDIGLAFSRNGIPQELLDRIDGGVSGMARYLDALIEDRRDHLGDDLLSSLITAQQAGERLTRTELDNLAILLVWAGQDTTSRQLGRSIATFCEHPQQWELLADKPELMQQAIGELLRWTPQARMLMRFAGDDLDFNGLEVPHQSPVWCCIPAGQRDPREYEAADRFDITVAKKSQPLLFGGGVYYCLGAALAQLEMSEGLSALTSRFTAPEIAGEAVWRPPMAVIHGPESLPVRFARGA